MKPGDKITASVVKTGTSYALTVTDATTSGNNISTTQSCAAKTPCLDESAEWIAEAPAGPRGYYPIPNFNTWTASAASVTSGTTTGTVKTFPDDEIAMLNQPSGGYALATPGALNTAGNGFSVTWDNSY